MQGDSFAVRAVAPIACVKDAASRRTRPATVGGKGDSRLFAFGDLAAHLEIVRLGLDELETMRFRNLTRQQQEHRPSRRRSPAEYPSAIPIETQ